MGVTASLLLAALALAALSLRLWRPGAHRQANTPTGRIHLPKPSAAAALFSRTHHEKLQDAKYLQSILEAELACQGTELLPLKECERCDLPSPGPGEAKRPPGEAKPPLDGGNPSQSEEICAKSEK